MIYKIWPNEEQQYFHGSKLAISIGAVWLRTRLSTRRRGAIALLRAWARGRILARRGILARGSHAVAGLRGIIGIAWGCLTLWWVAGITALWVAARTRSVASDSRILRCGVLLRRRILLGRRVGAVLLGWRTLLRRRSLLRTTNKNVGVCRLSPRRLTGRRSGRTRATGTRIHRRSRWCRGMSRCGCGSTTGCGIGASSGTGSRCGGWGWSTATRGGSREGNRGGCGCGCGSCCSTTATTSGLERPLLISVGVGDNKMEFTAASLHPLLWVMKRVPFVNRDIQLKGVDRERDKAKKIIAHETIPIINKHIDGLLIGVMRTHCKLFIPIGIKSLLDDLCFLCTVVLFTLSTRHANLNFTERITKAKSICFGQISCLNASNSYSRIFIHSHFQLCLFLSKNKKDW